MSSTCLCVVHLDNQISVLRSRVVVDVCTPRFVAIAFVFPL